MRAVPTFEMGQGVGSGKRFNTGGWLIKAHDPIALILRRCVSTFWRDESRERGKRPLSRVGEGQG
jgi:hypothetical protein